MPTAAEFASCIGKFKYQSRSDANKEARRKKSIGIEPYRCPFCASWHVGKNKRQLDRKSSLYKN